MDLLKTIGVRVTTVVLIMAVLAGVILWWRMDDASQSAIIGKTGRIFLWAAAVAVWPWVSFPLIAWVARRESNPAGAMLVLAYTLAAAVALAWLFDFSIRGAAGWIAFVAAVLIAGLYNLLICDWIADRLED